MVNRAIAAAALILLAIALAPVAPGHGAGENGRAGTLEGPPQLPATLYGNVTIVCQANGSLRDAPAGVELYFYAENGSLLATAETGNGTSSNNSYIAKIEGYTGTVLVYAGDVHVANTSVQPGDIIRLDLIVNDTTPPSRPAVSASVSNDTLRVSWEPSSDNIIIDHYEYTVTHNGTLLASGATTRTSVNTSLAGDGIYNITVTSVDAACNSNSTRASLIVDRRPPRIIPVQWPENGSLTNTSSTTVELVVVDEVSGVNTSILLVDGQPVPASAEPINATAWRVSAALQLGDGSHAILLRARDNAGNTAELSTTVTVDTAPPSIELLSGPDRSWTNASSIAFIFHAADQLSGVNWSSIRASAANATIESVSVDEVNGTISILVAPDPGNYTVNVSLRDMAGNPSTLAVGGGYDPWPPSIVILSPGEGDTVNSSALTIRVALADNLSGVDPASLEAWIDGYGGVQLSFDPSTGEASASVSLPDGAFTLHVSAADRAGNPVVASANFTVDTGAPTISVDGVWNGMYTNETSLAVTLSVEDPQGVSRVLAYLDGEEYYNCSCGNQTSVAAQLVLDQLGEGSHTLEVRAWDSSSNPSLASIVFTVDTSAPEIVITEPSQGDYVNTSTVTLEASAQDNAALNSVTVLLDGETVYSSSPGGPSAWIAVEITVPGDGAHTITVLAADKAGNTARSSVQVIVDTSPPVIASLEPANGSALNTTQITITIAVEEEHNISATVALDGEPAEATTQRTGPAEWIVTAVVSVGEGAHTIVVTVEDPAGNRASAESSIVVDVTPPSVEVYSPGQGGAYNTTTLEVAASAADNLGLSRAEILLDGATVWTGNLTGTSHSLEAQLEGVGEGFHEVVVTVWDRAGNKASASVPATVDLTPPEAAILSPENGSTINDSHVAIVASARDSLSGIDWSSTILLVDGEQVEYSHDSNGTITASLTLQDGAHTVILEARDAAGNTARAGIAFTVDTGAPRITIEPAGPVVTNRTSVNVTINVSDTSGLQTVRALLDGETVLECYCNGTTSYTRTLSLTGLPEGPHTLTVEASDTSGTSSSATLDITVDTTPPLITVLEPGNNTITNTTPVTLTAAITEATGLESVEVTVNGAPASYTLNGSTLTAEVGLSSGPNYIGITAVDRAGNKAFTRIVVTLDTSPPAIALAGQPPAAVNTPNITVTIVASDNLLLRSLIAVSPSGTVIVPVNSTSTVTSITIPLWPGENTVRLGAVDTAGNTAWTSFNTTYDPWPPTIDLRAPTVTNSSLVTITGVIRENLSGLASIELYVDGYPVGYELNGTVVTANITLGDGAHTVVLKAVDSAGNTASASAEILVDTAPPLASLSAPAALNTTNATIIISAEDDTSGIVYAVLSVDGSTVWSTGPGEPAGSISETIALSAPEGVHNIVYSVRDAAGNTRTITATMIVDLTPPTLEVEAPENGSVLPGGSTALVAVASDSLSGPASVTLILDGAPVEAANSTPGNATLTATARLEGLAPGLHSLVVKARDAAGNTAEERIVFYVDLEPPSLEAPSLIVVPRLGETFNVTVADDLLGVAPDTMYTVTVEGNATIVNPPSGGIVELRLDSVNPKGYTRVTITVRDPAGRTGTATLYVAVGEERSRNITLRSGEQVLVSLAFNTVPDLLLRSAQECNATILEVAPNWSTTAPTGDPAILEIIPGEECTLELRGYTRPGTTPLLLKKAGRTGVLVPLEPWDPASITGGTATIYSYNASTRRWEATIVWGNWTVGPARTLEPGTVYLIYDPGGPAQPLGGLSLGPAQVAGGDRRYGGTSTMTVILPLLAMPLSRPRHRRAIGVAALAGIVLLSLAGPAPASAGRPSVSPVAFPPSTLEVGSNGSVIELRLDVPRSSQTILTLKLEWSRGASVGEPLVYVNGEPQSISNASTRDHRMVVVLNDLEPPTGEVVVRIPVSLVDASNASLYWEAAITTVNGLVPDTPAVYNGSITLLPAPRETTTPPGASNTTSTPPTSTQSTGQAQPGAANSTRTPQPPASPPEKGGAGLPPAVVAAIATAVALAAAVLVLRHR